MERLRLDLSWTTASLIGGRLLTFGATVLVARTLSTREFALYLVFVAIAVLGMPVADGGMFPLVTRLASRHSDVALFGFSRLADRVRAPFWLAALMAAVALSLSAVRHGVLVPLAVVAAIGQAQTETLAGDLWGHDRFAAAAVLRLAAGALALAGSAALPLLGPDAVGAMAVFAVSRIMPVWAIRSQYPHSPAAFRSSVTLRECLPYGLTAFINGAYVQSDLLILALLDTAPPALGAYGLAYNVLVGTQIIPASISAALFPRFARSDHPEARKLLRGGFMFSFVLAVGVSVCIVLGLHTLFLAFGATYAHEVLRIRTLLLVLLPLSLSQIGLAALQARGHVNATLRIAVVTLIINVALNFALIPALGVRGAVLGTTVAELFSLAAIVTVVKRAGLGSLGVAAGLLIVPALAVSLSPAPGWAVALAILAPVGVLWLVDGLDSRSATRRFVRGLSVQR